MTDTAPDTAPDQASSGMLDLIERIGNRLPDPATLFLIGTVAVMVLSAIAVSFDWQVQPRLPQALTEVGPDGQDSLDAGAHESRGDVEPPAGADAPGDQPGDQADQHRGHEDAGGIESRAVGFLAAQEHGQGFTQLIGKGDPPQGDGKEQQAE